eukprot:m.58900 g.58900  ORF g.58900 m.58900 type:complete len:215 (+) comp11734_c0_seq1:798-1442(+)
MSSDEDQYYTYDDPAHDQDDDDDDLDDADAVEAPPKKEKKQRRRRRKKDPNKPRGALTPYMCFSKHVRPSIQEAHPGAGVTDIAKIIGQKWRGLTDDEKKPFQELAVKDRARYNAQMKDYTPTPGYEDGGRGRKRKQKDPNAPKKPKSAYFIYAEERRPDLRAANPNGKISEIAKLTGEAWRGMTAEEKQPYFDEAARLKQDYDIKVAEYKASL